MNSSEIFEILNTRLKITSAICCGLDGNLSNIMCDNFWSVYFVDSNSEWSWKNKPESQEDFEIDLFSDEREFLSTFDYLENSYDFAYFYNRNSLDFQRTLFISLVKKRTRYILVHPACNSLFKPKGYIKLNLRTELGIYILYYLDPVLDSFEEAENLTKVS